jgi:hypothetical protein
MPPAGPAEWQGNPPQITIGHPGMTAVRLRVILRTLIIG